MVRTAPHARRCTTSTRRHGRPRALGDDVARVAAEARRRRSVSPVDLHTHAPLGWLLRTTTRESGREHA